jgi:hypothetical protein
MNCFYHPGEVAVTKCFGCGKSLCQWCATVFQIPICPTGCKKDKEDINYIGGENMKLDIGTYTCKENDEICLVFAVVRSIADKEEASIFGIKVGDDYVKKTVNHTDFTQPKKQLIENFSNLTLREQEIIKERYDLGEKHYNEKYYFDMEKSSGNRRYFQNIMNYFSFSNYKGPMEYVGNRFSKSNFIKYFKPLKIVSTENIVEVGEIYINSSNDEKVFILGIIKTDNDEDKHIIITRIIKNENYNKYIDFDHDQMLMTPDFVDSLFFERKNFLKEYRKFE